MTISKRPRKKNLLQTIRLKSPKARPKMSRKNRSKKNHLLLMVRKKPKKKRSLKMGPKKKNSKKK